MNGSRKLVGAVVACGLAGAIGCGLPASAATHTPPQVSHSSPTSHRSHGYVPGSGWRGYHHGHGFYGYWPWYFPWTYGYGLPYYGSSFLVETPVSYVEMSPDDSQAVQPATSWYYCRDPEGYFPYVKTCPSGWQAVPIQPQAAPTAPVAAPTAPSMQPAPPAPAG